MDNPRKHTIYKHTLSTNNRILNKSKDKVTCQGVPYKDIGKYDLSKYDINFCGRPLDSILTETPESDLYRSLLHSSTFQHKPIVLYV